LEEEQRSNLASTDIPKGPIHNEGGLFEFLGRIICHNLSA
jgi:hypothetical protein